MTPHTIEDLIQRMGLAALMATGAQSVTVSTTLHDGCKLDSSGTVRIDNSHSDMGRTQGTVKLKPGSGFRVDDIQYWPPDGGTLDLEATIDRIEEGKLHSSTLHSWWSYKEEQRRAYEGPLVGQKFRARVSRTGSEVTLVLCATGLCLSFRSGD